ncbi:MAG: two-component system sensor histidine kinase [Paenibacillus sp.]|nr:two-component system sensor histidine kinase [Paenibacillus sp.]
MMKAGLNSIWRMVFPNDGLDMLVRPLALFTASCSIASLYHDGYGLFISALFSLLLIMLVRFRSSPTLLYVLSSATLGMLLLVFPTVQLYCFLLILYPLLLIFALLVPNPIFPFAAGFLSAVFLFRFQGQVDNTELWANVFAILLNALVYSLLTRMMRKLLKERNEYRQMSMIDSLTGLPSLQHTLIFGQKLVEKGLKVRVILIDLDYFKQINDTYGHMIGNKVIVHFASQLGQMMQGWNGTVGRLGGDEFVIVMEATEDSKALLNNIEQRLNHSQYTFSPEQNPIVLSFSIGEAESEPGATTNIEQLMHKADLNMYEYKMRKRIPMMQGQTDQLFELSPDPISTFDGQGNLLDLNPAAQQLLGYSVEEFRSLIYTQLIVKEDQQAVIEAFSSMIRRGSPANFEMTVISKSGELIPVNIMIIPIYVSHKIAGYYAISKNILERKKAENESRTSDKIEVLSRIATRFSEEIRGPLTVLSGLTRLLQDQSPHPSSYYSIMHREIERIELISHEVMLLSRPMPEPTTAFNPVQLIEEIIVILDTRALMANVEWELLVRNSIPSIIGDAKQLKIAFLHIMNNAIEAMAKGGKIQIELEHVGDAVLIRIRDHGVGMDEQRLRKLGEPFVTSKTDRVGIGLAVTLKIVENHRGSVNLCSEPDLGTTVELKLPS